MGESVAGRRGFVGGVFAAKDAKSAKDGRGFIVEKTQGSIEK